MYPNTSSNKGLFLRVAGTMSKGSLSQLNSAFLEGGSITAAV
jgi:hypothetical protein